MGFHSYYMTYEQCLEIAAEPGIDLVTSPSQCAEVNPVRIQGIRGGVTVALLAVGIGLIFLRRSKIKAAESDMTVQKEALARVQRFGYDPLLVGPGEVPFYWTEEPRFDERIDAVATTVTLRWNQPTHLPPTYAPKIAEPDPRYPAEFNSLLNQFAGKGPRPN